MNKNAKFMMKMGAIGIAVFLVYLAIPKINVVQSAVQLELERYEYYIPLEILETYVLEDSELYIQNNLGYRKIAMDEPFALENDTTLKIVQKTNFYKSEAITFEIKAIDTIPPIIVSDDSVVLGGGINLRDILNVQVLDYRYGEFDFELKNPSIDFVSIILGNFEYIINSEDLAGNIITKTIQIEVIPYTIKQNELSKIDIWVNQARILPEDFVPELVAMDATYSLNHETFLLQEPVRNAFDLLTEALFSDLELELYIENAYLSFESAVTSPEYQSGLSLDVVNNDEVDFKDTQQYQWLMEHAHEHGFILRYPEGKESVTGYPYNPQTLRYVGQEVASYLYQNELTFDEYKLMNLK